MKKIKYFLFTTLLISSFNSLLAKISIPILWTGVSLYYPNNISAQDVFYFLDRGNQNFNNGLFIHAINTYKEVLALENKGKNAETAYYQIASSYLEINDYINALNNSNELIKLNSYYPDAFFLRGAIYEKLKQYQNAVDDFTMALKRIPSDDPFKAKIYYALGNSKDELRDYEGAKNNYTLALKIIPSDDPFKAKIYGVLGISKKKLRDYEGAKNDFTKAINIDPTWEKLYKERAMVKGLLREMESGILDLNKAIDLKEDFASAYYIRAMFYRMLKKYKKACDDYQQANYYGDKRGLKEFNEMYCFDFVD